MPLIGDGLGVEGAFLLGSSGATAVLVYGGPLADYPVY